jgi:hypothetical protein
MLNAIEQGIIAKSTKKRLDELENRKMLIDTFVNSVVLYDDRIDFYFNFKDNAKSLTLSRLNTVSDLSSSSPP